MIMLWTYLWCGMMGCDLAPYPDYWPDKSRYPEISGTEPAQVNSRIGGETVVISGRHLSGTRTVVIGGRNAEIVSVDDRAVTIRMPQLPAGPERLAISIATGAGAATKEAVIQVGDEVASWWSDEIASAAVYRVDCPVEGWGYYTEGRWRGTGYPLLWCGYEMGWASADGFVGAEGQPGFAGELSGLTPLAQLPEVGESRVFGPGDRRAPSVPLVHGYHTLGERIDIQSDRDFARDLAFVSAREDLLWDTYTWWSYIEQWFGPNVVLFDEDTCRLAPSVAIEGRGDTLLIDDDASGVTGMWLGYGIEEEGFTYDGYTGTAQVKAIAPDVLVGEPSGVAMYFDEWSGWFVPEAVNGVVGQSELLGESVVRVSQVDSAGKRHHRGTVTTGADLDLYALTPDLMTGRAKIRLDKDLTVRWNPISATDDPTILAIEIAVYDTEIVDPNWQTEVARLVARGDDSLGELIIPASAFAGLPLAPNNWTVDDEFQGYWGDMTIARHQLRKVPSDEGDLVIDFVHAVNGPVRLK